MAVPAARKGDPTAHGGGGGGSSGGGSSAAMAGATLAGSSAGATASVVSSSAQPSAGHGHSHGGGASGAAQVGAAVANPAGMGAAAASVGGGACGGGGGGGGPPIVSGSGNVLIGGSPAARAGVDTGECDGHSPNTITTGAKGVLVNNAPLACVGDSLSCGSRIADGHSKTLVGTVGGAVDALRSKFENLPGVRDIGAEITEYWEDPNVIAAMGRIAEMSSLATMFIGGGWARPLPQAVSRARFKNAAKILRKETAHLGDDVFVHGSRASGTAKPTSDIDFGIRMEKEEFDAFVKERFGTPNPGSAKLRTMEHALETGKVQAGEAGLRGVRKQLEEALGMEVDISVIRAGGPFDKGPFIPVP